MPTTTRRRFTDAFKSEAVRLTRESGQPVAQVAQEFGISGNVLYRWMTEQRHVESQGRTGQSVRIGQKELTRLKQENETLRQERDFTMCGGVLREGVPMKYRAIREHTRRYPIGSCIVRSPCRPPAVTRGLSGAKAVGRCRTGACSRASG